MLLASRDNSLLGETPDDEIWLLPKILPDGILFSDASPGLACTPDSEERSVRNGKAEIAQHDLRRRHRRGPVSLIPKLCVRLSDTNVTNSDNL
jgi:hypothetical protein